MELFSAFKLPYKFELPSKLEYHPFKSATKCMAKYFSSLADYICSSLEDVNNRNNQNNQNNQNDQTDLHSPKFHGEDSTIPDFVPSINHANSGVEASELKQVDHFDSCSVGASSIPPEAKIICDEVASESCTSSESHATLPPMTIFSKGRQSRFSILAFLKHVVPSGSGGCPRMFLAILLLMCMPLHAAASPPLNQTCEIHSTPDWQCCTAKQECDDEFTTSDAPFVGNLDSVVFVIPVSLAACLCFLVAMKIYHQLGQRREANQPELIDTGQHPLTVSQPVTVSVAISGSPAECQPSHDDSYVTAFSPQPSVQCQDTAATTSPSEEVSLKQQEDPEMESSLLGKQSVLIVNVTKLLKLSEESDRDAVVKSDRDASAPSAFVGRRASNSYTQRPVYSKIVSNPPYTGPCTTTIPVVNTTPVVSTFDLTIPQDNGLGTFSSLVYHDLLPLPPPNTHVQSVPSQAEESYLVNRPSIPVFAKTFGAEEADLVQ